MLFLNSFLEEVSFFLNSSPLSYIFIIYMGSFIGSFINMLTYRIPAMLEFEVAEIIKEYASVPGKKVEELYDRNKNINLFGPRSKCPKCSSVLKWYHNIPVFSYVFLRGKCFFCKEKIPLSYFLIEVFSIFIALFIYNLFGFGVSFLLFSLITFTLFSSLIIDLNFKILPQSLTIISLFSSYLFAIYGSNQFVDINESIYSSIIIYIGIFSFINIYEYIRGIPQMMGRGDFGIYAIGGALLGLDNFIYIFIVSSLIGLLCFVFLFLCGKFKKGNNKIKSYELPFGPSIIVTILLPFFFPKVLSILSFI